MKKLLILVLLGVLFMPMNGSAKADEVLYCQSELATGLYKESGTWKSGDLKPKRFTVRVVGDFKSVIGVYADFKFDCHLPYVWKPEKTVCQHKNGNTFIYDKSSKRFIFSMVNTSTYLDTDTPAINAGTCQKF